MSLVLAVGMKIQHFSDEKHPVVLIENILRKCGQKSPDCKEDK